MIATKPEFLTLTDISTSPDNPFFELYTDVDVKIIYKEKTYNFTIPKGFVTDFGSVPKFFRGWISNVCVYDKAWIAHDFFYSKLCELSITRDEADCILRSILAFLGMNYTDRFYVYFAVKFFGKSRWKKVN